MPPSGAFSRARFLARVALGLPPVQAAGRFALVAGLAMAAGLVGGGLGTVPGVVVAALTGAAVHLALHRKLVRSQAPEFATMARRVGEAKTSLAESRAALSRLSRAVERAIPEVLAEDETSPAFDQPPAAPLPLGPFGALAREREHHLARRLLRLSRAAAFLGGSDLELKRLPLAGPCAEVLEQYRRSAGGDREVLYIEDGGGAWLAAPIDRPLFVMILRELLDNVFEHGGDWSRITVTTEPVSDAIVLRVRDDGRGMAPGALSGIARGGTSEPDGLGLVIVRAIVEAHGGAFRIESEPGRGTSVNLRFPTIPGTHP